MYFQQLIQGQLAIAWIKKRNNTDLYLKAYTKINFRWTADLSVSVRLDSPSLRNPRAAGLVEILSPQSPLRSSCREFALKEASYTTVWKSHWKRVGPPGWSEFLPVWKERKKGKKKERENEMFQFIFASSNIMKIIGQACHREKKRCNTHDTKHWWISFFKPGDVLCFHVWLSKKCKKKKMQLTLEPHEGWEADSTPHSAVENPRLTFQLAPIFKVPQP